MFINKKSKAKTNKITSNKQPPKMEIFIIINQHYINRDLNSNTWLCKDES